VEQTATALAVDIAAGLSHAEAERRLARFGPNSIPDEPPTSWLKLILAQFDDLLVKILLGAAGVSFCLALTEESDNRWHAMVEPFVIVRSSCAIAKPIHATPIVSVEAGHQPSHTAPRT
jgi:magnesium-transporting ATPase (P-type)